MIENKNIKYEKNIDYVYIYNLQQAYFYIQNNLLPLKVDKHPRTNRTFFVFDREKSNPLFTKWLIHKDSQKMSVQKIGYSLEESV